jgi:hypothetical protein
MKKHSNSILEFDQFLNEPSQYENEKRVREFRYEAYGYWRNVCVDIAILKAEIAELRKDAERYRWLRSESSSYKYTGPTVVSMNNVGVIVDWYHSDDDYKLDNDIDAIIAAEKDQAK